MGWLPICFGASAPAPGLTFLTFFPCFRCPRDIRNDSKQKESWLSKEDKMLLGTLPIHGVTF